MDRNTWLHGLKHGDIVSVRKVVCSSIEYFKAKVKKRGPYGEIYASGKCKEFDCNGEACKGKSLVVKYKIFEDTDK